MSIQPDPPESTPGESLANTTTLDATKGKLADTWTSVRDMRPRRNHLAADLIAGLTFAAVNVPQGLAYALMAGVNPVFGLYTLMIATPLAALTTSAVFMNVSSTSALSASTSDVLQSFSTDTRASALVTLVLLVGLFQLILGILKLGYIMQFVPNSVMVGFIQGVAVLIILGQLGDFTGFNSSQNNKVLQLADLLLHNALIVPRAVIVGFTTIGLILVFERSRREIIRNMALFLAMGIASAIPWLLQWDNVQIVRDVADIPQSLPHLAMPDLSLIPGLLLSAAALGLLGLVQAASVAQTFPNPDGKFSIVSRDFLGQGIANLATSFFQGIPAGGSTSGTGVLVGAGAQTRWANIFGGIFVALIVLLFGNLAEFIAMPALAGLLIVVGIRMINLKAVSSVWQTGPTPRVSAMITFIATLIVPLQAAILVGVIVAVLLHVFQQSQQVNLVELVWSDNVFPKELPAPKELPSHEITTLQVYGTLFFAAAGTFEKLLPSADNAKQAIVILLLRGHSEVGSTFINALTRYAQQLTANNGKLMLVGVSDMIYTQLDKTGAMKIIGQENLFPAEEQWGVAMQKAYSSALASLGASTQPHPHWLEGTVTAEASQSPKTPQSAGTLPPMSTTPAVESSSRPDTVRTDSRDDRLLYLEELERLAELKDKGIVTEKEFNEKKHQILGL